MTIGYRTRRIIPIRTTPWTWPELHAVLRQIDGGLALAQQNIDDQNYVEVPPETYLAKPASTSSITTRVDFSQLLIPGLPILYVYKVGTDELPFYGVIDSITSTAITIRGAPIAGNLLGLYISYAEMAQQLTFHIPGEYGDGVADLLLADLDRYFRWDLSQTRLVGFAARHTLDATTANPYINVKVAGNLVSTANSNNGIQPTTSWVENPAVSINTTNYLISRRDHLEIACTVADNPGAGNHAANLSICLWLIHESRDLARILTNLEA